MTESSDAISECAPARPSTYGILPCLLAVLSAAAAAALIPTTARAQVSDTLRQDTVYELKPISVRAVRPSATTGGVGAVTVRMDSVRFRPAPLLEDVMRELPLVQVRRNSRGEAQLALRGAEERQIAILLDGVPLTIGWDHRTDLSVIPLTAARSVRLVRGMSSVLHGPNVLGGVVDVRMGSVPAGQVEPLRVSAGLDQNGGYATSAMSEVETRGDRGRLVLRGGIGRREHEGFVAPDASALYPALTGGDVRVNSDLEHTDAFLSARFAPAIGGWISGTVSGFRAERGVPPELTEEGPRLWRYPEATRLVGILAGGVDGIENELGELEIESSLGLDMGHTRIENFAVPVDPASPTRSAADFFSTLQETEESDDRTTTLRLTGTQRIGAGSIALAITGAEVRHDEVITVGIANDAAESFDGTYRQRLWSLAAESEIPFDADLGPITGGRVSAGLAWDGADTPEPGPAVEGSGPTMTEWGGRVGISASTGDALLIHTAVSRRGRFPSLREMYSAALGRFHPNPGLRPELLTAVEAGFTGRFAGTDLQVVGFHQRLDHAITRGAPPADSDARYMRVNRNQIRSTGLELLAGYTLGAVVVETEMTVQSVEVVEPGLEAVRAEYEPELAGGIGGTVPLIAGIQGSAEVEYWGRQFCSAPSPGQEDYVTLDPGTRADVQLARSFRLPRSLATFSQAGIELAVDNVADATIYDQCGLPQPGRTLRVQVRLN